MGRAKARGRGPSWSDRPRDRPGSDAPIATDKARAGARACAGHAAQGDNPMRAMTAWAPGNDQGNSQREDQGRTPCLDSID